MVDTHLIAEYWSHITISMKIDPYCQRQDGRRTGVKKRKLIIFYRMQRHFSHILNSHDTKTGDFERHLPLFNVRKLHRPRWKHIICCACYAFWADSVDTTL